MSHPETPNALHTSQDVPAKYYIRRRGEDEITGPFTATELKAQLEAGTLTSSENLALRDSGQSREQLAKPGNYEWVSISAVTNPESAPSQTPQQSPLIESLGAGAFAGLGAGLASHYMAGGKLTFPIWIAAYVLVISGVKNKMVATIVFVPVAALVTVVMKALNPAK